MKKIVYMLFCLLICVYGAGIFNIRPCYSLPEELYIVKDSFGEEIFEGLDVEVGDKIITRDYKEYEVVDIDETSHIAYAEYNGRYIPPTIVEEKRGLNLAPNIHKSVGLYMTHNDESYITGDGYDSVYGEGGIHDVARILAEEFDTLGYEVYLDETLHIPHDKSAYTRSNITAKKLLTYAPDALFDIHRDGASRSLYVKNIDGKERCKVRIVVGQANPNYEVNLQFALYLMSVADSICPWLFLDIYNAKGHYNQALSSKGLLFEMGSHLVEKNLVLDTVPYLANVVDKTLFNTVASENDDTLLITDDILDEEQSNIINNVLEAQVSQKKFNSSSSSNAVTFACAMIGVSGLIGIVSYYRYKKITKTNKKEPKTKRVPK